MTNEGLREVVKFCKRCPDLRVLKLFGNQLDDEACKELVSVFKECTGLEELHLSHNWITETGVEMLAESALHDLSSRFSRPFWLRVEHNNFSYVSSFIEDLKNKFRPDICGREDRRRCSNRECVKNCRLHIPFLVDDKGARASRGDSGNWGRWNNHRDDWSYKYDYDQPQYKARSRSRTPQARPIRLTERQLSPPPKPKQRPRDRVSERSPIDRREIYYDDTAYSPYPAYSNRRMRPHEPAYHPPARAPRAPSPPVRSRRVPPRPQPSPPRPPSYRRPVSHAWPQASGRRNRQTPMEPRTSMQQMQQAKHQALKHQPQAGPVRRPPSPPKPKSQQAQYALPTSLPQAPVDVDGESEYSYDYYSDDYSYDDDDPPTATGAVGHPSSVVVPPMVNMTREAPPPIPSSAPKARPPPRQPPRAAPRARATGAERHLVNRYEALRNPGGDRLRQTARRRAS
eukprot:Skav221719  [mRNA]  locus=scaffold542:216074:217441:- [translate_table: standard]